MRTFSLCLIGILLFLLFHFSSDVSCCYPLQELIDFHRNHGKEGTIVVILLCTLQI